MAAEMVMAGVIGACLGSAATFLWVGRGLERLRGDLEQQRRDAQSWRQTAENVGLQLAGLDRMANEAASLRDQVVARLLDAALPARETVEEEKSPESPPEYEAPWEPVPDWTDAAFGVERPLVGGLRPGEGVPGIGGDMGPDPTHTEDYYNGDLDVPLPSDDDLARWQDVGEEVGEQWLESRER